jgi:hypothetical protein
MGERIRLPKNDRCCRVANFLKIIKEAVVCQGAFRFRCQVSGVSKIAGRLESLDT